ncbi:hypothetical protein C8R43DRAFT_1132349 [Mycena crocata]|nr:hypothetical protein C8R43DRAFT_1132349 [Mycena crocata]
MGDDTSSIPPGILQTDTPSIIYQTSLEFLVGSSKGDQCKGFPNYEHTHLLCTPVTAAKHKKQQLKRDLRRATPNHLDTMEFWIENSV